MRIVVALGGNALARRGEPMTADHLRANVRSTCEALAGLARQHELVITHGNGPQVGLLALQNLAYQDVAAYPLDILGAETQGMIGYVIQQELSNALAGEREVAAIVTTTEVDEADPAFERPTKLIGPQYSAQDAAEAAAEYRWTIARDGAAFRRVVPSPAPRRIVQAPLVRMLLENGRLVVCVGGGGVPVKIDGKGRQTGMQAVVDKDLASAALAAELKADMLVMLTDGDYVSENWGTPEQRDILTASPEAIAELAFAEGSMKPKVDAAVRVAKAGGRALIGPLERIDDLLERRVGTEIRADVPEGIVFA
ncbi:carbamate kinase [Streptomyces sp. NPDC056121]|jgi:carbamate kinase|uniref:carbamate kinase n=1 Tax=unclassified Streptomyces TaxID=2593676 RepID=UPI000E309313|nr:MULTISPECIES: carbamate kinase [unclassified Streptomyces]MCX5084480.1 carbamate kinase [Streptomyces sp. NBC_00401]RFC69875.1 carbamate kinase [Streptomyces sp. AcE210]